MVDIAIGKYTLESLTTGMYLSPMVLYREYIQNSIDSINEAVALGHMKRSDGRIVIEIDKKNRRISIEDNGLGIPLSEAPNNLLDIGNSRKLPHKTNGFRGIGRLVGLSYSERLIFETSFSGERQYSKIIFDGTKLNEYLRPGKYTDYDIKSVLRDVTIVSRSPNIIQSNLHYFKVTLEGVTDYDGVLNKEMVINYISQVAPIPYDPRKFTYIKDIHEAFYKNDIELEEFNIVIRYANENEKPLFKRYSNQFLADKQRKIWDTLKGVNIEEIRDSDNNLIAIMWHGKSGLKGSILDEDIKGIRLRKGNILIGDKTTLNLIFKEDRFNGWLQGEVFVIDNDIIPNARRDNFERNHRYQYLLNSLTEIGNNLSKTIRDTSAKRNKERLARDGLNMDQGGELLKELTIPNNTNDPTKFTSKEREVFRSLQVLQGKASSGQVITKYQILNASTNITIAEKKILEKVFDTIKELYNENESESAIYAICKKINII